GKCWDWADPHGPEHRWVLHPALPPAILRALVIIEPETVVRWHRAGFRCYWHWRSRSRGGWPQTAPGPASLCIASSDNRTNRIGDGVKHAAMKPPVRDLKFHR